MLAYNMFVLMNYNFTFGYDKSCHELNVIYINPSHKFRVSFNPSRKFRVSIVWMKLLRPMRDNYMRTIRRHKHSSLGMPNAPLKNIQRSLRRLSLRMAKVPFLHQ